jgi:epoxide hydrolase-like predicted phosphatase
MQSPPQALLFDLGGVVIDIDFDRAFTVWAQHSQLTSEEIKKFFTFDDPYQRHERGEISASAYYDHLAATLQLDTDHAHIADGWNSIFVREISGTTEAIRAMRKQIPCYAFTNTNAAHMAAWTTMFPSVASSFDRIFASHQMGLRKPERQAFDHIAQAIAVAPRSILFFDDLLENVQAAAAAGLQAIHVRSPDDVRNALEAFGYSR